MGFLDEIKNKMHLGGQQGYDQGYSQDDDYGYDDGYDDGYQGGGYSGASGEGFYTQDEPSNGLLGHLLIIALSIFAQLLMNITYSP